MIFSNLKQFFINNKKIFYYLSFILTIFLITTEPTFAAEGKEQEWIDTIATFFHAILSGVSLFLGLVTYLVTIFLSPEWINGGLFGMHGKFKEIWILVSNMVYFIFAFILIWIAFMNIIGKGGDKYQLKQALPKFIVGVLIVPFSWFLVQFILSISAILTVSALTLPANSFPDYSEKLQQIQIPTKCEMNLSDAFKSEQESSDTETKSKGFFSCDDEKENIGTVLMGGDASSSIYGTIALYTYGVIGFENVSRLKEGDIKQNVQTIGDLIVRIVFDFLFVLIYMILIITLGFVLLMRGIYIWIYTMMSPIFGLMYFFDKKEGSGDSFFSKFNIMEFISLAMVPVYTMLALSFGLLFMYIVGTGLTEGQDNAGGNSVKIEEEDGGSSIIIGDEENDKTFSLKIVGGFSGQATEAGDFMKEIGGGVLGAVGGLILKLFGVVVLWGSVIAAMQTSKITEAIVKPIADFGNSVGDIVTSAPMKIPAFGGMSADGLKQMGVSASSHFSEKSRKTGTDFMKDHGLFGQNADRSAASAKAAQLASNNGGTTQALDSLNQALKKYKRVDDFDSNIINSIKDNGMKLNLSDTDKKFIEGLSMSSTFDERAKALAIIDSAGEKKYGKEQGSIVNGHYQGSAMQANKTSMNKVLSKNAKDDSESTTSSSDNSGGADKVKIGKAGSKIKIDIGGNKLEINDKNSLSKDDKNNLISELVKGLNKGIVKKDDLKEIMGEVSSSQEEILKGIYYNKKERKYGIKKVEGYEISSTIEGLFEK